LIMVGYLAASYQPHRHSAPLGRTVAALSRNIGVAKQILH
jgi:hypothetical protein